MNKTRVRELVKKALGDKSASAFAREMGVTHTTVANWLKGDHMPDLDSLTVIAKKAGITPEEAILYVLDKNTEGDVDSIHRQIRALHTTNELIRVIKIATDRLEAIAL
ncbi:MAG: helix-turn-helix transcriptional regulator [Pseudanabaenaceae cyanobacterium bins.68]|nr:helix-turn-helix transcriptional regulator [Pseudanabaenaceae cyanobacterium bins.68]